MKANVEQRLKEKKEQIESIPNINTDLETVKKMIQVFEKRLDKEVKPEERPTDKEITIPFEYIIGSLFPKVYDNIMQTLSLKFAEGYSQGYKDAKDEIEGNN